MSSSVDEIGGSACGATAAQNSAGDGGLSDLISRLEDRRRLMWNAPLKGGGFAKLVSPEDLSAAIRALCQLEVLTSSERLTKCADTDALTDPQRAVGDTPAGKLMRQAASAILSLADVGCCDGCGSTRTQASLEADGYRSCCPERKMLSAKEWSKRALKAEVERDEARRERDAWKQRAEDARYLGDNHHNAIACPYCNPNRLVPAELERRSLIVEQQLAEAVGVLGDLLETTEARLAAVTFPSRDEELAVSAARALLAQHKAPVERLTPAPPWPVSPDTNCKREGWRSFFAGVDRDACPFPLGRADLQRGFREGWDAAAQHQSPQSSKGAGDE